MLHKGVTAHSSAFEGHASIENNKTATLMPVMQRLLAICISNRVNSGPIRISICWKKGTENCDVAIEGLFSL